MQLLETHAWEEFQPYYSDADCELRGEVCDRPYLNFLVPFCSLCRQLLRLKTINITTAKSRADRGNFSYFVSPKRVEIW